MTGTAIELRAVIDDIEITGGRPADETIRRVGQLG